MSPLHTTHWGDPKHGRQALNVPATPSETVWLQVRPMEQGPCALNIPQKAWFRGRKHGLWAPKGAPCAWFVVAVFPPTIETGGHLLLGLFLKSNNSLPPLHFHPNQGQTPIFVWTPPHMDLCVWVVIVAGGESSQEDESRS